MIKASNKELNKLYRRISADLKAEQSKSNGINPVSKDSLLELTKYTKKVMDVVNGNSTYDEAFRSIKMSTVKGKHKSRHEIALTSRIRR
tara:strand:+ start:297 stop:563 length:267 start_codon:yes stop_codon:yes gene_type:complete